MDGKQLFKFVKNFVFIQPFIGIADFLSSNESSVVVTALRLLIAILHFWS